MASVTMEEFEALLQESFEVDTPEEGTVVKGKVIAIEAGQAIIDVGYKMEGRVDIKEFADPGEAPVISVGDMVEVFLRAAENAKGEAVIITANSSSVPAIPSANATHASLPDATIIPLSKFSTLTSSPTIINIEE